MCCSPCSGLGKLINGSETTATQIGTLAWTAPEVLLHGVTGPPTDIYALGTIIYEVRLCEGSSWVCRRHVQYGKCRKTMTCLQENDASDTFLDISNTETWLTLSVVIIF